MLILAIETSTGAGSIALLEDDRLVSSVSLDPQRRTAQSLAPTLASQLRAAGWLPQQVNLVAVSQGPGSFTGLRVGVTTAKAFAYGVGAEVLGVNTLEAIAAQTPLDCPFVWAVVDAQRGQVFTALFRQSRGGDPGVIEPTTILDAEAWLSRLSAGVGVTGPGLVRLADRLPPGVRVADRRLWTPQAATVGQLAALRYQRGERADLWALAPQYYRPSAADEKLQPRKD